MSLGETSCHVVRTFEWPCATPCGKKQRPPADNQHQLASLLRVIEEDRPANTVTVTPGQNHPANQSKFLTHRNCMKQMFIIVLSHWVYRQFATQHSITNTHGLTYRRPEIHTEFTVQWLGWGLQQPSSRQWAGLWQPHTLLCPSSLGAEAGTHSTSRVHGSCRAPGRPANSWMNTLTGAVKERHSSLIGESIWTCQ